MDWNEEHHGRQRSTGIIEMLVVLAFLADCACSRSRLLRVLVLSVLAPAAAFARNFVIVEAQAAGVPISSLPVPTQAGDSIADAMRLAACFRALAMVLRQLPVPPNRMVRRIAFRRTLLRHSALMLPTMSSQPAFAVPQPFDTS